MTQYTYNLSDTAKRNIAANLQLPSFSDIIDMDAMSLDQHIEKKIGKKLRLSTSIGRLIGRGTMYTFFNRILTREWIDKQIEKINR